MSRNKLYEARIEVCLLPEVKVKLEKKAKKHKRRVNELIREAIDEYLFS